MINVSLKEMLEILKESVINQEQAPKFYYKQEDGYTEITEVDLLCGRFRTIDGDFSEFEWELERSNIYRDLENKEKIDLNEVIPVGTIIPIVGNSPEEIEEIILNQLPGKWKELYKDARVEGCYSYVRIE